MAKARRARKRVNTRVVISNALANARRYAKMISDPCHSTIVTPMNAYGGTVAERLRKTFTLSNSTSTCGYVVWFPTYHGKGADGVAATAPYAPYVDSNLLWFDNALSSYRPINNLTNAWGCDDAVATSGKFLFDPAGELLYNASTYSRAKTLAACLQLEWLGATMDTAGQVAVLQNMSLINLSRSSSTGTFGPPSVDDIFSYSAQIERTQLSGHEVIWRPSEDASVMRQTVSQNLGQASTSAKGDCGFWSGTKGSGETKIASADPANATGIVIAWRGFPAGKPVSVNVVKVVELELAARNNAVETRPLSTGTTTKVDDVVAMLDSSFSSWQLGSVVNNAAGKLADVAGRVATAGVNFGVDRLVDAAFAPASSRRMRGMNPPLMLRDEF